MFLLSDLQLTVQSVPIITKVAVIILLMARCTRSLQYNIQQECILNIFLKESSKLF